jgi:drug/metabolite transporter (DMT)-like permease
MRARVILGLVVICVIWGTTWLGIKIGLKTVPPVLGAALRFLLAAAILGTIIRLRGIVIPRERSFWNLAVLLGLTSFSVPYALVYWGQQYIPSALSSILFATYPLFVALLSHLLLAGEEMNAPKWMGTILGFVGIAVIFWSDFRLESPHVLWGMAAIVASSFLQAIALISARRSGERFSSFSLNFAGMSVGCAVLLVLSFAFDSYGSLAFGSAGVASILYLSIFGSVIAFVVFFWLVKHVEAVLLALTAFVTPILAVVVGALVLHERLPADILAGSALVLTGILLANLKELHRVVERGRAFLFD